MDESASWLVTTLPSLAAIHIAIINFLICQVTSCGHVFKGACNFKAPHHKSQPAMFGGQRHCVTGDCVTYAFNFPCDNYQDQSSVSRKLSSEELEKRNDESKMSNQSTVTCHVLKEITLICQIPEAFALMSFEK